MNEKLNWFLSSNDKTARCARTIVQGVCGVVVGIAAYYAGASEIVSVALSPLTMAVLSPVMALLGEEE